MKNVLQLAFPIVRTGSFRTYGPLIHAASEDPAFEVTLALGPHGSKGTKSYQDASKCNLPAALEGRCRVEEVSDIADLADVLSKADAVVSHVGRSTLHHGQLAGAELPFWVNVYDAHHNADPSLNTSDADLVLWPSPLCLEEAIIRGAAPRRELEAKSRHTGWLRSDGLASTSKEATRYEWGIPNDRPVVLLVPDAFRLQQDYRVTDWYRQIWCREGRPARVLGSALRMRSRWGFREALRTNWNHAAMVRRIREFCDRNEALLVLMHRRGKEIAPGAPSFAPEEAEVADFVVTEDEDYPQTMPKATQMADLVVCPFRSGTVMDAAAAGTPYVTIGLPAHAYARDVPWLISRYDVTQGHNPGVNWVIRVKEFMQTFASRSLDDFRLNPDRHRAYTQDYLGTVDGRCSLRALDTIREALDACGRATVKPIA